MTDKKPKKETVKTHKKRVHVETNTGCVVEFDSSQIDSLPKNWKVLD